MTLNPNACCCGGDAANGHLVECPGAGSFGAGSAITPQNWRMLDVGDVICFRRATCGGQGLYDAGAPLVLTDVEDDGCGFVGRRGQDDYWFWMDPDGEPYFAVVSVRGRPGGSA